MFAYKVKVLNGAGWRNYKIARIDVSLQNEKQTLDKLKATLEWAKQNFNHVYISLADTLQRHTFAAMYHVPVDKAMGYSKTEGDIWLALHKGIIEDLEIVRWADYLNDDRFFTHLKTIRDNYNSDSSFRSLIDRDAQDYLKRKHLPQETLNHVLNYILEEQAVFAMIANPDTIGIYAGSIMGSSTQSFCKIDFLRKHVA